MDSAAASGLSEFIFPFGKHKGASLKDMDLLYLAWAIGYKRSGMKFAPNPDYCVSDSHPLAYEYARTWRGAAGRAARRRCVSATPSCARRAGCAVKIRDGNRHVILLFKWFVSWSAV